MEAPLGETGLIEDDRVFGLAQRLILLRGKPHVLSGQFLSRVLMSPLVRKQIYARATGTTVKGIASKRLQQIAIPIPPLQEQKWIVAQLDALQAQLDSLRSLQRKAAADEIRSCREVRPIECRSRTRRSAAVDSGSGVSGRIVMCFQVVQGLRWMEGGV